MINLYTAITNRLEEITGIKLFFNEVPSKNPGTGNEIKFPYVVYKLPNSSPQELLEEFVLEIDVWDGISDVTRLEKLTEEVNLKLHKWDYLDENFFLRVKRINRLPLDDPDGKIKRRQLRFTVKVYISGVLIPQ